MSNWNSGFSDEVFTLGRGIKIRVGLFDRRSSGQFNIWIFFFFSLGLFSIFLFFYTIQFIFSLSLSLSSYFLPQVFYFYFFISHSLSIFFSIPLRQSVIRDSFDPLRAWAREDSWKWMPVLQGMVSIRYSLIYVWLKHRPYAYQTLRNFFFNLSLQSFIYPSKLSRKPIIFFFLSYIYTFIHTNFPIITKRSKKVFFFHQN